jgi:hypothetical protein
MSARRAAAALIAAFVAVVLCAGCGSGGDGGTGAGRGLTDDEANLLANALFDNRQAGGSTFELAIQVAPGATINLQGEIDWTKHRGHALVVGKGTEEGVREVYWDDSTVLERRDDLNELLAQTGRPGITFVARPADVQGRDLDQTLGVVTGLASEQRDNPLLIKQAEGSTFVRTASLRSTPVSVLRYGPRTTYWLSTADGSMLRFEGNNTPGTRPVVVDLLHLGAQTIAGPQVNEVVAVAEIQDLYDGFAKAKPTG